MKWKAYLAARWRLFRNRHTYDDLRLLGLLDKDIPLNIRFGIRGSKKVEHPLTDEEADEYVRKFRESEDYKQWRKESDEQYAQDVERVREYFRTPQGQDEARGMGYDLSWIDEEDSAARDETKTGD